MKRISLLIPLLLLEASRPVPCPAGERCICSWSATPEELISQSALVFEGRIIEHQMASGQIELGGRIATYSGFVRAVMKVTTVWKGSPGSTIVLYDADHLPGDSCELAVFTGTTYLILAKQTADSVAIDACSPVYEPGTGATIRSLLGSGKPVVSAPE